MNDNSQNRRAESGPFGTGWQGHLIIAIVIVATAHFAATTMDWMSMLVSALVPPLIFAISHCGGRGAKAYERRGNPGPGVDILGFLARTNPIMFLLVGALSRRQDDAQYQQLLSAGPYASGWHVYLLLAFLMLLPLICVLILSAIAGQLPTHSGS